jgi:hypothetical protein
MVPLPILQMNIPTMAQNILLNFLWENVLHTPASPPIGLPSRSNSASISSTVLLIIATILGILALITASKCWMNKWKHIGIQFMKKLG